MSRVRRSEFVLSRSVRRPVWTLANDERRLVDGWRRRYTPDGSGSWKLDVLECEDFGELVEVGVHGEAARCRGARRRLRFRGQSRAAGDKPLTPALRYVSHPHQHTS
jgi:hypothetical protein